MELLLTRPFVVGLALLGALFSTLASILQMRRMVSPRGARILNYTGYALMGASMLLFVFAGLLG